MHLKPLMKSTCNTTKKLLVAALCQKKVLTNPLLPRVLCTECLKKTFKNILSILLLYRRNLNLLFKKKKNNQKQNKKTHQTKKHATTFAVKDNKLV